MAEESQTHSFLRAETGLNPPMFTENKLVNQISSNGGIGVLMASVGLLQIDGGEKTLLKCVSGGLTGNAFWFAYKDHCNADQELFIKKIKDWDPVMIDSVNKTLKESGSDQVIGK